MADDGGIFLSSALTRLMGRVTVRLRVRGTMPPVLALCWLGVPSCFLVGFLLIIFANEAAGLGYLLIYVGVGLLGVAAFAYFFFMISNPDRLQSEDYQLEQQRIDVGRQQNQEATTEPEMLELSANPADASDEREGDQ